MKFRTDFARRAPHALQELYCGIELYKCGIELWDKKYIFKRINIFTQNVRILHSIETFTSLKTKNIFADLVG